MPRTDTAKAIQFIYDIWGVWITTAGYSDNQARLIKLYLCYSLMNWFSGIL